VSALPDVHLRCRQHETAASIDGLLVLTMWVLGLVLYLALGLPVSAETAKSKEVISKPPTSVEKLKEDPAKLVPDAASAKDPYTNPALCAQPDGTAQATANGNEAGEGSSRVVGASSAAKSGGADSGAQSSSDQGSSEMITDKLKLSLEPKADSGSEPAAQCGRDENATQARDKADAPPN
jgi:hypothetical protein